MPRRNRPMGGDDERPPCSLAEAVGPVESKSETRRSFLGKAGVATVAVAAAARLDALAGSRLNAADTAVEEPVAGGAQQQRRNQAALVRHRAELLNHKIAMPPQIGNGDEAAYPARIASFSKGLPHDGRGEVDRRAYDAMLAALASGRHDDFERIPMGWPIPDEQRKLVNPMAGIAFDLQGVDSHQLSIPPAPAFASAEAAGEMTELYWMALLRDVNYLDYETSPAAAAASSDLSRLADFRGPKAKGRVTPATLFRDDLPGCSIGPYISQFLWMDTPFGAERVDRRMRTPLPGDDHGKEYSEWLALQNGRVPTRENQFDPLRRYIRNGRDLSEWVHVDVLFQAYFNAMLILLTPPNAADPGGGGVGAPLNPGNPYLHSKTQAPFGTFGGPYIATLVAEVATRALKAVWYQKWYVHRRLRPEVFAGRIHNHVTGSSGYPIHPDVLNSEALARIFSTNGSYLLPLAFPEGSPLHPSYGAGHATVAGACVTILKALFDESFVLPDPVVPTSDGLVLAPYDGPDAASLTIGGELNKLASNVATGRNTAGVHWRSDATESLKLGESVAIGLLRDQRLTYKEEFGGYTFTRFDGTSITV